MFVFPFYALSSNNQIIRNFYFAFAWLVSPCCSISSTYTNNFSQLIVELCRSRPYNIYGFPSIPHLYITQFYFTKCSDQSKNGIKRIKSISASNSHRKIHLNNKTFCEIRAQTHTKFNILDCLSNLYSELFRIRMKKALFSTRILQYDLSLSALCWVSLVVHASVNTHNSNAYTSKHTHIHSYTSSTWRMLHSSVE